MKYFKKNFTLIELLAAMGIFSILLVLSMQFFTSAQRMWTSADEKSNLYNDARLIMDLISTKLQSIHYSESMPFEISQNKILFASKEKLDSRPKDNFSTRFLAFNFAISETLIADSEKVNIGVLRYQILSDNGDSTFYKLLPPYTEDTFKDSIEATEQMWSYLNKNTTINKEETTMVLSNSILDFSLKGYKPNNNGDLQVDNTTSTTPPYLIEITLTMINPKVLAHINSLPKIKIEDNEPEEDKNAKKLKIKERIAYLRQNSHTFKRSIFLSDRWYSTSN